MYPENDDFGIKANESKAEAINDNSKETDAPTVKKSTNKQFKLKPN